MEFGKIPNVDKVDWKIPSLDPLSKEFLGQIQKSKSLAIYFGAPAWSHKEWVGKIYPEKAKSSEFLYYYSRYFSCIELNTSHYRIPTQEQTDKWASQTPKHFLFCPKIFQGISHERSGLRDKELHKVWWTFLSQLKNHCGPSFLQLPPYFDYSFKSELFFFLQNWPSEYQLAIEFRHPSWFQNTQILPALTQYLQKKKIGLVITDVAGRRDVLHSSISSDFSMLRFIGNDLHPSDFLRAKLWLDKFSDWQKSGLKNLFLFVHEPDDVSAPDMTQFFLEQIKTQANLSVQMPEGLDKIHPTPETNFSLPL